MAWGKMELTVFQDFLLVHNNVASAEFPSCSDQEAGHVEKTVFINSRGESVSLDNIFSQHFFYLATTPIRVPLTQR